MPDLLSPRQAADMLGVSESTIRRWCDRSVLPMTRTRGRHRRIARSDLLAFARREGLMPHPGAEVAPSAGRGGRLAPAPELCDRLFDAMVRLEDRSIRTLLVEALQRGMAPAAICDEVVAPAMHRLGEAWADRRIQVFQEHGATEAVREGLAHTRALAPVPAPSAPVAIAAALSDDPYVLAPAMAAFVLQAERYRVVLLGADTPALELGLALAESGASLVAISIGGVADRDRRVAELESAIADAASAGARLAVGGMGLDPALRRRIFPDFFGDTMAHLAAFASRAVPAEPGSSAP